MTGSKSDGINREDVRSAHLSTASSKALATKVEDAIEWWFWRNEAAATRVAVYLVLALLAGVWLTTP